MRNIVTFAAAQICILCASAATAAEKPEPRPAIFQKLIDCRGLSDNGQRLACFDAQVALLDEAEAKQEVVVVDKGQIKQAKKSLFGLSVGKLPFFGNKSGDDSSEEGDNYIDSKISGVRMGPSGKWIFTLEDGARWSQTEYDTIRQPKNGDAIRIKKTTLGGYMANINGGHGIRVKREN